MRRMIDLSQLSVPQLLEIRRIIAGGVETTSETQSKAGKLARALREENEKLKREKRYREIVESYGLEWDDPEYFLGQSEENLHKTCELFSDVKREAALAEKTNTMKIPPFFQVEEVSGIELVRQELNALKHRKNGRGEHDL